MRGGCPVDVPAPDVIPTPHGRCDLFTLMVMRRAGDGGAVRTTGNVMVRCLDCDMGRTFGPMSVGSDRDPVQGAETTVAGACRWMATHAEDRGMPPAEAEKAFQAERGISSRRWKVREWAAALLRGHQPRYKGMIRPRGAGVLTGPGVPHVKACGFYMLDKATDAGP